VGRAGTAGSDRVRRPGWYIFIDFWMLSLFRTLYYVMVTVRATWSRSHFLSLGHLQPSY